MAGKSSNSFGSKNWSPGPPATRYNASGKNREFYTFENAPGIGAYATGGTIIDGGDGYIYHIFTGSGTFTVNRPPAAIDSVDYLIVAGGGGRVSATGAGGGGAGGLRQGTVSVSPAVSYPVTIGAGGPTVGGPAPGRNGNPSSVFSVVATGGGGGGYLPNAGQQGGIGGSGGGGGTAPAPVGNAGAGGPASPVATIPYQGWDGSSASFPAVGGGGGGAGGRSEGGGASGGGPGRIVSQFPAPIIRLGVPGATFWPLVNSLGYAAGGAGFPTPVPLSRTSPVGSGFGGTNGGLAGGSGIVCIRYKKNAPYTRATGGTVEPSTDPEHPGVWRHIFTSPGDFTVTDPTLQWIDYLAVGGGGGGGGGSPLLAGGGGGAGGFVSSIHTSTTTPTSIPEAYPWNPGYSVRVGEQYPVGVGTYPIGIGTGGNAATAGNNTTIGSPGPAQIIAAGGGLGGTEPQAGGAGGSGGGGGKGPAPGNIFGGTATPTPLIQGNNGGVTTGTSLVESGSGGGGAGASGGSGPSWAGGNGWYSVLSPSAYGTPGPLIYRYFAGGGGGVLTPPATSYPGGAGGGGTGNVSGAGTPGTTNTGGGGGGGYGALGGSGGPGIVIIQYPE